MIICGYLWGARYVRLAAYKEYFGLYVISYENLKFYHICLEMKNIKFWLLSQKEHFNLSILRLYSYIFNHFLFLEQAKFELDLMNASKI